MPESRILAGLGYIYSGANLLDETEIKFRQALKLDPRNPERMNDLEGYQHIQEVEKAFASQNK